MGVRKQFRPLTGRTLAGHLHFIEWIASMSVALLSYVRFGEGLRLASMLGSIRAQLLILLPKLLQLIAIYLCLPNASPQIFVFLLNSLQATEVAYERQAGVRKLGSQRSSNVGSPGLYAFAVSLG
jgi:hypothetical protein